MNEPDTYERLKNIMVELLDADPELVSAEKAFGADLDAYSLDRPDRIDLMIAVEEEFGIVIEDADAERIVTVGDALAVVQRLLASQGRAS